MERRPGCRALPCLLEWATLAPLGFMLGAQVRPLDSTSFGYHVGAGGSERVFPMSDRSGNNGRGRTRDAEAPAWPGGYLILSVGGGGEVDVWPFDSTCLHVERTSLSDMSPRYPGSFPSCVLHYLAPCIPVSSQAPSSHLPALFFWAPCSPMLFLQDPGHRARQLLSFGDPGTGRSSS